MLDKVYKPQQVEEKWIELWQKEGVFKPVIDKSKKPFSMVIPPPNITGALHMGHALNNTLQDIIIRYRRMMGQNTYWVVGTDHGGIATQNVMEKMLKSEGKTKEEIGREEFLERMWKWYAECGGTILNQLKKLGCSIDFSKENVRFTMDEKRANAVYHAFKELWDKGLIYRGERMINWCPRCYTALSDIEVEYVPEKSYLWYVKYPVENSDEYITVATTRPETMLGDTAVCVNPKDKRYKKFIGKNLILPLVNRKIPVIADDRVDMEFGTGAVKITPAHDPLDFEISQTHGLEIIKVISDNGRMINCPEKYEGLKVLKARQEVVNDLKEQGYLLKEEPYEHNVGKCYRCETHIEPLVSEQWFVKTKDIVGDTIKVIVNEKVKFYPDRWVKPLLDWLNNIQDWCISRQIWWGHRIPAWYCRKCSAKGLIFNDKNEIVKVSIENGAKPVISKEKPAVCHDCGGNEFVQDPDVLDTWFSSALWPFSVFGWPEKTKELEYFYPTEVLVTGYEILYLWVARMITSGLFHMGEIPFSKVIVHGIVRDKRGQKMSKSKGNVIDPLDMMKKYGTDAMRFALAMGSGGGKDIPFSEDSIVGPRNFINKIYNVSRFIQMNVKEDENYSMATEKFDLADKWILTRVYQVVRDYKKLMNEYMLSEALDKVYAFAWDEFCDWYIEISKIYLNTDERNHKLAIILLVFNKILKMLHPFTPFVTQELYSALQKYFNEEEKYLVNLSLNNIDRDYVDETSTDKMKIIMGIVKEIRTIRSEFSIHPGKEIDVIIVGNSSDIVSWQNYIKKLAKISILEFKNEYVRTDRAIKGVYRDFVIYVKSDGSIDFEKEKARITREIEELLKNNEKWDKLLKDRNFMTKAPKTEVDKVKKRIEENNMKLERLKQLIEGIK